MQKPNTPPQAKKQAMKIKHSLSYNQNQKINSIVNYKQLYEQQKNLRISIENQLGIEKIKVKKLMNGKIKGKVCPKCLESERNFNNGDNQTNSQNLVENFKQFSSKLSSIITSKTLQEQQSSPVTGLLQKQSELFSPASNMSNYSESAPIIQNFTVYGVSENSIPLRDIKSIQDLGGQVLYSLNPCSDMEKQAVNFIFPSGVAIKRITGSKAKDKAIQIMSFCYTNLKSFILGFKSPGQSFPANYYDKNELLNYVNKQKNVFFTCIGVRDYTWIDSNPKKMIISLDQIQQNDQHSQSNPSQNKIHSQGTKNIQDMEGPSNNSSLKSVQGNQQIALTQRVFCISSYFPFFTFYEQILRSLINNIKMERLHMYKLNSEDMSQTIKQTDSKYQLSRIQELFNHTFNEICHKKMQFNRSYEIKLINQQKITLLTDWNYAKTFFIDQWIFTIMSMFTMDTFLDLWTEIILEEGKGVVFVCENSHILTYTVYLFGNILCKPFAYAYPVVNIVPEDQDFLDSPFPVIYGMFKKRKYVEQNQILERYNDRTYVFLNAEKVQIAYSADSKKNVQKRKPSKLKTELSYLFKDLKKNRKKQTKSSKYEIQTTDYCYMSTIEERQNSIKIVQAINHYIQNEIVKKIPSKIQIEHMNKKIQPQEIPAQKTIETYLIWKVVNSIKKSSKDPFLERFLQTQTFSNYLLEQSEIIK